VKHVDGAAKMLEIRGSDQLTRREGLDMFTHLRTQIVSYFTSAASVSGVSYFSKFARMENT
jgi:hypothetical protein